MEKRKGFFKSDDNEFEILREEITNFRSRWFCLGQFYSVENPEKSKNWDCAVIGLCSDQDYTLL